ncbi:MAG: hypothetical protein IKY90_08910 [Oscillospiraceae bacterium]|nr:hypothetical protein [Oscillospiraceae bacterium]
MKVNKPDFGRYISNGLKLDYDGVANAAKITQNISVQMTDRMDDAVIEAIEKAAKEAGITDLFIINKKSVIDALKKQIPKKVKAEKYKYGKTYHCPVCNIFVGYEDDLSLPKYCKCCGQALSYDEVQEK